MIVLTGLPWQPGHTFVVSVADTVWAWDRASHVFRLSVGSSFHELRPVSPLKFQRIACCPRVPFFVMIWMTPFAASAPYSVAAAGPLMISIDSMSFGFRLFSAEVTCDDWARPAVPPPVALNPPRSSML